MSLYVWPPVSVSVTGVATEVTLSAIKTSVDGISTKLDSVATETTLQSVDTKLTTVTDRLGGTLVPSKFDYIVPTIGATTDVYVYKTGGSGGTTVRTITITYADSTKATISSIAAV